MALARVTVWSSGQVLKAADLNGEFNNILNNALSLISPLTGNLNANSNQITNLVLEKLAAAPAAATQGRVWVNTANTDPGIDSGSSPTLSLRTLTPQVRFVYATSSQALAQPYNGNRVPIKTGNAWETWPITASSGIAFSSTMLTNSTSLYYAYLYNNSGTLTGVLSTAPHSASTDVGVEVMTTDATRTLVGLCQSSTTAQYYSTLSTSAMVSSWAHRRTVGQVGSFSANRTTVATTFSEINTEIRVHFTAWSDDAVWTSINGRAENNTGGQNTFTAISYDGNTTEDAGVQLQEATGQYPIGINLVKTGLSEGYHYATLVGRVSANTGTWSGSTTPSERTTINVGVRI